MSSLYVGNLSFTATEENVRAALSLHGEVAAVRIVKEPGSGRSLGFAIADMSDAAAAQRAAKALHNHEIAGRPVRVSEMRPRDDQLHIA